MEPLNSRGAQVESQSSPFFGRDDRERSDDFLTTMALTGALQRMPDRPVSPPLDVAIFARPPTVYVSQDAHLAWYKIAHQCGIGRSGVRLVATDNYGRTDAKARADAMEANRSVGPTGGVLNWIDHEPTRRLAD